MINQSLLREASQLQLELQSQCIPNVRLYQSGHMKSNIFTTIIDEDTILVTIGADYAAETNNPGRSTSNWIYDTVHRVDETLNTNNDITMYKGV